MVKLPIHKVAIQNPSTVHVLVLSNGTIVWAEILIKIKLKIGQPRPLFVYFRYFQ